MANITEVNLLCVPLEKDYAHTLYFSSKEEQQNYFSEHEKMSFTDFSYQRKDSTIRVPAHIDTLYDLGCNYVSYRNNAYSNRTFYAFITEMRYVNDERTDVVIETDCLQTWLFDVQMLPSFVEREHAANDEPGEHTIDEGLETGDYKTVYSSALQLGGDPCIVAAVTKTPDEKASVGKMYHGMYSGLAYIPFPQDGTDFENFVKQYDGDAAGDAIAMVFLAPQALLQSSPGTITYGTALPETKKPFTVLINKASESQTGDAEVVVEFPKELDGYTPKNKKLLTYPYRYLLVSNNAGAAAVYKFEKFRTRTLEMQMEPSFIMEGCLTPGCSIRLIPVEYNGAPENHEEGINMGKYPTLNWTSDAFTNWLTQNSVNIGLNIASGAAQIIGGAAVALSSGGLGLAVGGGSIAGGLSSVAGTLGQIYQQSLTPPQAKGNTNCGDVITAAGDNEFKMYVMTIKKEYAALLDDFFSMYGYKCHRVKIPEKNHRLSYWYTKTIDANITGEIPQGDLQTIKNAYNKGITFWKTRDHFRDYSVANDIV